MVAAAVILPIGPDSQVDDLPAGLNDSKKLTAIQREALFEQIQACALAIGVGEASVAEIDEINILHAAMLAMHRAVTALPFAPDSLLIDGNRLPKELPCPAQAVVKGDARSLSIAAASIIAKVTRDRIMTALHAEFPIYGWDRNSAYGVAAHKQAMAEHGVTEHHRRSFRPVREILERSGEE
ncbi:putative RNase HII [Magnetofaba australis IT-1]|uniref:Ribonuclease n=1 Tax=Magnetofaba australis IT-1 TaxID=1434232 RepID=A0A1Y2K4A4_9PROT|nr:putative RNase HII [Magnetofaba australis IT-1]